MAGRRYDAARASARRRAATRRDCLADHEPESQAAELLGNLAVALFKRIEDLAQLIRLQAQSISALAQTQATSQTLATV